MVTETLVKESLSIEMISAGQKLTLLLDENNFNVTASLWFYMADVNIWRFIIASTEVGNKGLKATYERVQQIISKAPASKSKIALKDISLLDSSDPLISLLKIALRTDTRTSGIRFSQNTINGVLIEDAYIYRLS